MNQNKTFGKKILHFEEVTSTNTLIFEKYSCEDEGFILLADKQTNGKGRLGRVWNSESNDSLYFSVLLKPIFSIDKVPLITICAGIAVCTALRKLLKSQVYIKWPNDILINNKKVCGILSEGSFIGDKINFVVCGIGININNRDFNDQLRSIATSLFIEERQLFNRKDILKLVLSEFENIYRLLQSSAIGEIIDKYKDLCCTLGRTVTFNQNDQTIIGMALDINLDGSIKVQTDSSFLNISSGEMNFVK